MNLWCEYVYEVRCSFAWKEFSSYVMFSDAIGLVRFLCNRPMGEWYGWSMVFSNGLKGWLPKG